MTARQEHLFLDGLRTGVPDIVDDGFTHIRKQWKDQFPPGLMLDDPYLVVVPVHVFEPEQPYV